MSRLKGTRFDAARFVQMNLGEREVDAGLLELPGELDDPADRWILSVYNRTIETVTSALDDYRFDEASRGLYEFVWNSYCDWYVELAKVRLNGDDPAARDTVQRVLVHVLEGTLRLLHPWLDTHYQKSLAAELFAFTRNLPLNSLCLLALSEQLNELLAPLRYCHLPHSLPNFL